MGSEKPPGNGKEKLVKRTEYVERGGRRYRKEIVEKYDYSGNLISRIIELHNEINQKISSREERYDPLTHWMIALIQVKYNKNKQKKSEEREEYERDPATGRLNARKYVKYVFEQKIIERMERYNPETGQTTELIHTEYEQDRIKSEILETYDPESGQIIKRITIKHTEDQKISKNIETFTVEADKPTRSSTELDGADQEIMEQSGADDYDAAPPRILTQDISQDQPKQEVTPPEPIVTPPQQVNRVVPFLYIGRGSQAKEEPKSSAKPELKSDNGQSNQPFVARKADGKNQEEIETHGLEDLRKSLEEKYERAETLVAEEAKKEQPESPEKESKHSLGAETARIIREKAAAQLLDPKSTQSPAKDVSANRVETQSSSDKKKNVKTVVIVAVMVIVLAVAYYLVRYL